MSRMSSAAVAVAFTPAVLAAAPAAAQEAVDLEPVVLSGGLTPIAADAYGGSASVITREELEARGATRVAEALRSLPGVSVARTGGGGGLTRVRLRGAESTHTLVLIDGVEVSAPEQGEYDFGGLLAADVERIEVLRGPQSALYGANAVGGVISITTRGAEAPGLRWDGEVEGGSDGTAAARIAARGMGERGSFSLSLARRETEGFDVSGTPGGESDGDRNLTFNGRGKLLATDWLTLGAHLRLVDRHSDTDGFAYAAPTRAGLVYDDASALERREILGGVDAVADLGRVRAEMRADYLTADDSTTLNGADLTDSTATRLTLSTRATAALDAPTPAAADHTLTLLAEYERETFVNNDPALVSAPSQLDEQSRDLGGFAAEYRGAFLDAVDLQLSLRHDVNDSFEDATTWSAGASWRVARTGARLHASAGRAVQNPSIYDQFGFIPGQWQGNPDLEPEESFGWDIGIEQTFWDRRAVLDVTYFNQDLDNEIGALYLPPSFAVGTPVNQDGTSHRQGVEVSADLQATDRLRLGLSYTYLDATDPGDLAEARRPMHEAAASAELSLLGGRGRLRLDARYAGGDQDLDYRGPVTPGARVELADYVVVDIAAAYDLTDRVEIFGRVENALDVDYEEVYGYETPGVTAYAGLRARW